MVTRLILLVEVTYFLASSCFSVSRGRSRGAYIIWKVGRLPIQTMVVRLAGTVVLALLGTWMALKVVVVLKRLPTRTG